MNERVKKLTEEAAKLSREEQAELLENLYAILDPVDPAIERAWIEESERRIDAYLRGEITSTDANEVLAKYLKS
jgi:Putative addiction module component